MSKKFIITIQDDHGLRQFSLSRSIKKRIKYIVAVVLGVVALSMGANLIQQSYICSVKDSLNILEDKNKNLLTNNDLLSTKLTKLQTKIDSKSEELASLDAQLNTIEEMIGLSPSPDLEITERVELASITSEQMEEVFQDIPNGSPIEYKGITSRFGYRHHPLLKRKAFHKGSDMRAAMKTPVYATANAVVEYAGWHKRSGFGRLVILSHNYGFKTYFGHLKKINVKMGQVIKKGDLIAYTGNSGKSNGPHLHYEVQFIAKALNPFNFIKWTVANYQDIFTKEKQVPWHSLITMINKRSNKEVLAKAPKVVKTSQNKAIPVTIPPLSQQVRISQAN